MIAEVERLRSRALLPPATAFFHRFSCSLSPHPVSSSFSSSPPSSSSLSLFRHPLHSLLADTPSLPRPSRPISCFCIMNSLVATPPIPPHFYENPRLSPSRPSMTTRCSRPAGLVADKKQCLLRTRTPVNGKPTTMATITMDGCQPLRPTPLLSLPDLFHRPETSNAPARTSLVDLSPFPVY